MTVVLVLVIVFAVVGPALMLALATAAEDSLQRATESTARPVPPADPAER
jgi:hypothetical protein